MCSSVDVLDQCVTDATCQTGDSNKVCVSGNCVCVSGYHANKAGQCKPGKTN